MVGPESRRPCTARVQYTDVPESAHIRVSNVPSGPWLVADANTLDRFTGICDRRS